MSSLVKELNSGKNKSIKSYYFALRVFIHTAAGIKSFFFPTEGGSETESTVDSDFGRGDLLASSDPLFTYKPRYILFHSSSITAA